MTGGGDVGRTLGETLVLDRGEDEDVLPGGVESDSRREAIARALEVLRPRDRRVLTAVLRSRGKSSDDAAGDRARARRDARASSPASGSCAQAACARAIRLTSCATAWPRSLRQALERRERHGGPALAGLPWRSHFMKCASQPTETNDGTRLCAPAHRPSWSTRHFRCFGENPCSSSWPRRWSTCRGSHSPGVRAAR